MAGKKKAKKKATRRTKAEAEIVTGELGAPSTRTRKAKAKKKVAAKRGPKPGKKYGPRKAKNVYRVVDINGVVSLGDFASIDAACDAIAAQAAVKLILTDMVAAGESEHVVASAFTWTIIDTQATGPVVR